MSVSSLEHLEQLDLILYNRPAGRNIIGYAIEEIERLRENQKCSALEGEETGAPCNTYKMLEALKNDEIAKLRAEVEALRVDAERYRWLRDHASDAFVAWADERDSGYSTPDDIDADVDRARA